MISVLLTSFSHSQSCDTTYKSFAINRDSNDSMSYVRFVSSRDNYPSAGKQTWYYEVKSGKRYAISHVSFGFAYCVTVTQAGTWTTYDSATFSKNNVSYGTDPTTRLAGYKFDAGFNDDETRKYYLVVDKIYKTDSIKIAVKGGTKYDTRYMCGPSTSCDALPIALVGGSVLCTGDSDVVSWTTATEINVMMYEVSLLNDTASVIDSVYPKPTSFTVNTYRRSYAKNNAHAYVVRSIDLDGSTSAEFYLYPSRRNYRSDLPLEIYPNPAHDILFVGGGNDKMYVLYDAYGRMVQSGTVRQQAIALNVPAGIYIIVCDGKHATIVVN